MKKISLIFISLVLLFAFVSCGNGDDKSKEESKDETVLSIIEANNSENVIKKYGSFKFEYVDIENSKTSIFYYDGDGYFKVSGNKVYYYNGYTGYYSDLAAVSVSAFPNFGYNPEVGYQEDISLYYAVESDTVDRVVSYDEGEDGNIVVKIKTHGTEVENVLGINYIEGDAIIETLTVNKDMVLLSSETVVYHIYDTQYDYCRTSTVLGEKIPENLEKIRTLAKSEDFVTGKFAEEDGTVTEIKVPRGGIVLFPDVCSYYSDAEFTSLIKSGEVDTTKDFTIYIK